MAPWYKLPIRSFFRLNRFRTLVYLVDRRIRLTNLAFRLWAALPRLPGIDRSIPRLGTVEVEVPSTPASLPRHLLTILAVMEQVDTEVSL